MVIGGRNSTWNAHLDVAYNRQDQSTELQVCELFTNAAMPTSTERLIWAFRAFAHCTEAIVDLFAVFVNVLLERLLSLALWICPTTWDPFLSIEPQ
jgi:hypothetical protein